MHLRSLLLRSLGSFRGLTLQLLPLLLSSPFRPGRDLRLCQRPHRLEGDPGGPRRQGRPPRLKKGEVKVEVEEGNVLQISGERSREQEEKTDTWHRVERSSSKFLPRFRLPENAKVAQVKAAMGNGVLTEEVKKPEAKSIG